ncbi:PEGA domain-containing protein [bacterium]|nr:PEGA domain-containing protein [bacterium]
MAIIGIAFYILIDPIQTKRGELQVLSNVKGATILIDGIQTSAKTDTTLSRIIAGRKLITVQKEGYKATPEVVLVNVKPDSAVLVRFTLFSIDTIPVPEKVALRSPEEETLVSIERNLPEDSLPRTASQSYLEEAQRLIAAEEKKELAKDETVVQTPPKTQVPRVKQTIEGTSVRVTSQPEDAEIIINDDSTGYRTNRILEDLARGTYYFKVSKKGYIANPDVVRIDLTRDFQSEIVAFELSLDQSLPPPKLTVITEPVAGNIQVNGRPVGKGRVVLDVTLGKSVIEFSNIDGYVTPLTQTAVFSPETTAITVVGTYKRIEGKAQLAVLPRPKTVPGDELRILLDNDLILDNPGKEFQGVLMHKMLPGRRLLRVEFQNLVKDVHVELTEYNMTIVTFTVESFLSTKRLHLRVEDNITQKAWEKRAQRLNIIDKN